jgi:transcriptional regulator with XRE-family HTH domain
MNYQIFTERLRSARLKRNWSQATLAEKVGTFQSYISALEQGKRPGIEATTFFRLAKALGVSAEWLAGETE